MATITNNERTTIKLLTGHVIPRLGVLETDNATIRQPDNWPSLSGRALAGQITIAFDPDPDPAEPDQTVMQTVTPHEPTAVLQFDDISPPPASTDEGKRE